MISKFKATIGKYYNGPTFQHSVNSEEELAKVAKILTDGYSRKEILSEIDIDITFNCSVSYDDLKRLADEEMTVGDLIRGMPE